MIYTCESGVHKRVETLESMQTDLPGRVLFFLCSTEGTFLGCTVSGTSSPRSRTSIGALIHNDRFLFLPDHCKHLQSLFYDAELQVQGHEKVCTGQISDCPGKLFVWDFRSYSQKKKNVPWTSNHEIFLLLWVLNKVVLNPLRYRNGLQWFVMYNDDHEKNAVCCKSFESRFQAFFSI